jgi:uncharacterized tellurite resistance protein B-like protein
MFDSIRKVFSPKESEPEKRLEPTVQLAACALLLEVAWADGEYTASERKHMEDVVARHFGVSPADGARLLAEAESARSRSVDHFQFTRVLQANYDVGQKMVLAEVMWGMALADGKVTDQEQYITRKICNLLDLEPAYLSTAKAAAEKVRKAESREPRAEN